MNEGGFTPWMEESVAGGGEKGRSSSVTEQAENVFSTGGEGDAEEGEGASERAEGRGALAYRSKNGEKEASGRSTGTRISPFSEKSCGGFENLCFRPEFQI